MSDLEVRSSSSGARLDHPEGSELLAGVQAEIDGPTTTPAVGRRRRVVRGRSSAPLRRSCAHGLSLPASRTAIADFFRVDGVELRSRARPPEATPSSTTLPALDSVAAAEQRVDFTLRVAKGLGTPPSRSIRRSRAGSSPSTTPATGSSSSPRRPDGAVMAKFMDPRTHVARTEVRHEPRLLDHGNAPRARVPGPRQPGRARRRCTRGHVLLWSEAGVTIRVEGPETLAQAQTIAASLT